MEWYLEEEPTGNQISLARGITTVGRTPKCTLQLDSSYCSRAHCNIEVDNVGASTNGTYVNGKCYINMDVTIADGDKIGIGCWPFETVTGTDKLPIYYIRRKHTTGSIVSGEQQCEEKGDSENDKSVICISDDEDDGVDLQKYACESQPQGLIDAAPSEAEVFIKVETNMDVDEYLEPPQFLPAATGSNCSAVAPSIELVASKDLASTSGAQFLPSKSSLLQRPTTHSGGAMPRSVRESDQILNQPQLEQISCPQAFEDRFANSAKISKPSSCFNNNDDVENMDVDTILSQSTLLDIKQEIADLDCEQSFELKGELVEHQIANDHTVKPGGDTAEQLSSPVYVIDDDNEDEEEELFSIWTQKLSQSFSSTKSVDDPIEKVNKRRENQIKIKNLSHQMQSSTSLDGDEQIKLKEKKREGLRETRLSAKKDEDGKRGDGISKIQSKQLQKDVKIVDKSDKIAELRHKLDNLDVVASTSRASLMQTDSDFNHFEPKRKRPEVIDAPSLPTGKGKLRGLSAGKKPLLRNEIEKKIQSARTANQEKLMKEKWRQKPSLERQDEKDRLKAIHEVRKMKLKEMANEQAQKRKSEPEDHKVLKKPKVKVTERNRGAYLAEDIEVAKAEVLAKKIPKLRSRESSDGQALSDVSSDNKKQDDQGKKSFDRRRSNSRAADESATKTKDGKDEHSKILDKVSEQIRQSPRHRDIASKSEISEQNLVKRKSILKTPNSISLRKRKSFVRFAEENKIRYYEIDPNNNLGRKVDCKDAPMSPAVIEQIQKRAQEFIPAVDCSEEIINIILGWDPNWLGTEKHDVNGRNDMLMPMVQQYRNFEEFSSIVLPLFKLELWYSIQRDFERRPKESYFVFKVNQFVTTSRTKSMRYVLHCEANTKAIKDKTEFTPQQLCVVNLGNLQMFGIITFVRFSAINSTQELLNINVELRETGRNKIIFEKLANVKIKPISNIRVECGIYNAINNLQYSPLGKCILNPFELVQNNRPNVQNIKYTGYNDLNSNQRAILLEAYLRCIDNKKTNNLFLIEGPPGTGKSRIITNLALQTLYGEEVRKLEKKKKILICAQSNAAVDIIALKLLEIRGRMDRDKFNLVRFGVYDRIHYGVRCISLQALVQSTLRDRHTEANREILKNERKLLESQIEKLGQYASANNVSRDELQKKKDRLVMINQLLGANISTAGMERAYPKFLAGAHIVCTTLSSCIKLFNHIKKFDVCIIDEATQCAEPYTLIPLQFGISSLILVGDTQQLPATVLSTEASDREFGRSLFTRIQKCLEGQKNCPIQLLRTQYRMHPDICCWPNSYFYNNVLNNHESTKKTPNRVKPYAVLSLEYSQDGNQDRGKVINVQEAKFVVELLSHLVKMMSPDAFSYGIITPYAHHKEYLQKKIIDAGIKKVIVNTIDSYQGKERDVVIISCVRTSGVGFLGNSQRLNVALTRAKKCLFVCGNFNSLQREHAWKSLLENAKNRKLFHHFRSADFGNFEANVIRHLVLPISSNVETITSS